jgi:aminoglycoside phosphotransferase (APT) family kinase protein
MERRKGVILRSTLPQGLPLKPDALRRACETLIDNLARLHSLDYRAAGLGDLGKPDGYVERQVTGWAERYRRAQTSEVEAIDEVAVWLGQNRPADTGPGLIHNDYKFDNLVLDPVDLTRIVAVLDWEMATIGDPLMDLGTTLGYWVEASDPDTLHHLITGPTNLPGALSRRELAERYLSQTGRGATDLLFYYVFGLFKIVGIVQQIFARHVRGHTHDKRFAHLDVVVASLGSAASQAIEKGCF